MLTRATIVTVCLLAGAGAIALASEPAVITTGGRLDSMPLTLSRWAGRPAPPFDDGIIKVLGVDEYIHRMYVDRESRQAVWLYVGFYGSQGEGDSIHSPLNCLPGAGWEPVDRQRVQLRVTDQTGASRSVDVNELVIEKGADRQIVIYWYQSQGRVMASEYASKFFTVVDAMRSNRSDGAFIRVIAPVTGDAATTSRLVQRLASDLFPEISRALPL